jgi:hypothetical protein
MFFDDLGQKIGKIRYHYFQNWHFWALNGIFEMMMKICLGVIRFEIGALFENEKKIEEEIFDFFVFFQIFFFKFWK